MSQAKTLTALQQELEKNYRQLPLVEKVEDIVHGEGNQQAEIMFIGEAPGYYEALQRRPFVGRSGQLLRKTMEEVGLQPAEVYISNIIKVRPPDNRDPLPNELLAFKPYLDQEIAIIKPKLIVTLGRFSMAKFLPDVRVSQVHGRLHKIRWQERLLFILPMYHPAAALRSTQVEQSFLADFKKIKQILPWIEEALATEALAVGVKAALF